MSPTLKPTQKPISKRNRRVLPVLALLAQMGALTACASTQARGMRPLSMQLELGSAAQHRLLTGAVPAALRQGPVTVSAYVFTQPGSLVSVFARVLPNSEPGSYALDVRIPQSLIRQPLLVRVSGQAGFYQGLIVAQGRVAAPLVAPDLDDTTTVVAQVYVAARAAQSWPSGTQPEVLTRMVSPELALAVRQAPNVERTLAAVTPGVVAAVCAWQTVMRSEGAGELASHGDGAALVAALVWHTESGQVVSDVGAAALADARSRARCVDCAPSASQLALAAQASRDAWLVYADKLPWALRSQALVDAAVLQAHFMVAMVAEAQNDVSNAQTQGAAAELVASIDAARKAAAAASPTATAKSLQVAFGHYAQNVWDGIDAQTEQRTSLWADRVASVQPSIAILHKVRSSLNSRVAPAQAAASVAQSYVRILAVTQALAKTQGDDASVGMRLRLSAALTLRSSMLAAMP